MAKPLVVDGQPVLGPDKSPIMVPDDITPDEVSIIMGDLSKPTARETTTRVKEFGRSTLQGLENLMAGIDQLATLADIKITEQAAEQQQDPLLLEEAAIKREELLADTDDFSKRRAEFRTQQAIRLANSGIDPDSPGALLATFGGEILGESVALGPTGGLGRKALVGQGQRGAGGLAQRSAGEAAIGAAEGAVVFAESEQERGMNIALQGGTSGFLGNIFEIVGGARRAFSKGLLKEVVDDGADEVQRSLALAQRAELEDAASLTPGQASGGPKTQQLEAGLAGAVGSPFQNKLRAQQAAALGQYNKILDIISGGPALAPNRAAEVLGDALARSTGQLRELRRRAWIGGIKDSLERVGGKIDEETGRILNKGEAVVPTENTQRILAGWKAELANKSSSMLPAERTLVKNATASLEAEIAQSGGFLSIGTISDWLINTTKSLDAPKFNAAAAEAKDAMLRDLNTVAEQTLPGFDDEAALALLNTRARYAVDSTAISKLEKSAVGDIFDRFDVDVLSEDLGQQLLTLSPGQLKTSLSEVGGKVGRQYADAIRAEYLRALRSKAVLVDQATGRVEGVDPVTLLSLVSKNREQIAQILPPEVTRKQAWLDGIGIIERFARAKVSGGGGRSIMGEQAETVLTAGTLATGADVASLGFAARALFGRFSQSSFEKLLLDPKASQLIQRLGTRSVSTSRAATAEVFGNLVRYINQQRMQQDQKRSTNERRLQQITVEKAQQRAGGL